MLKDVFFQVKKLGFTLCFLLFALLINISNTGCTTANAAVLSSANFLGENRVTNGNWIGVYGSEGYILPFFSTTVSLGREPNYPNYMPQDIASLPVYVSSYSYNTTAYRPAYWVNANPSNNPLALTVPDGTIRKDIDVYQGVGFEYTFNVSDNNEHMFTVYAYDSGTGNMIEPQQIEIRDVNNTLIDSRQMSKDNCGVYYSYIIKGSFKIRAKNMNGFFFDSIVPNTIQNISLNYLNPRSVDIHFLNADVSKKVSILAKTEQDNSFNEIAQLDGSTTFYTHTNLESGTTYQYMLRSIDNYKYSEPSSVYSITIPAYSPTNLQFLQSPIIVPLPEQTVNIQAKLTDSLGNGIAGEDIIFTLSGKYVGTYIDANIGTAVTDDSGVASIGYTPPYAGEFEVTADFKDDDIDLWGHSTTTTVLTINREPWSQAPVILKLSDAIKPGMLLSINGYGMNGAEMSNIKVKVKKSSGTVSDEPPVDSIELTIEQLDPRDGFFVITSFPNNLQPGVYDVWIKNEYGWSKPARLNAPRPLFISEYEAFKGLEIEMSGRNLQPREFGATDSTLIRLNNGNGGIYNQVASDVTPYSVKFTIDNTPLGVYWVEVSNDSGVSWVRLGNGQQLTVVEEGLDPLGLGVAWADDFKWGDVFNVLNYGATNNDTSDDTQSVDNAIKAAKQDGGGVVYFPSGVYYISRINLPADIVLLGEDEDATFLYHNGGTANLIQSADDGKIKGVQGIAKLSIKLSNPDIRPDAFVWLGNDWGPAASDKSQRTAERIFLYDINLDYPVDNAGNGARGLGAIFIANERVLIKDCYFKGWSAGTQFSKINKYVSYKNNYYEFCDSDVVSNAAYTFMEGNHLVGHPESGKQTHGLFANNNVHMYDNIVENMGADVNLNDGEALCVEIPNLYYNAGEVLGGTISGIVVAPRLALASSYTLPANELNVMIVGGKGIGQYRKVISIDGNRLSVDKPWDVVPDRSSIFTLIGANDNVTFYRNTIINCAKGIWFYGNVIDGVASDNISCDSEGIFAYTNENASKGWLSPDYFINIRGNTITGISRRSRHAGISLSVPTDGELYANEIYGVDIRDNLIEGVPDAIPLRNTEAPDASGIVSWCWLTKGNSNPIGELCSSTNAVIENNRSLNLVTGINLTPGDYGYILRGNSFTNVQKAVETNGDLENMIVQDVAYSDNRAPYWPAFSQLSASYDKRDVVLTWPAATDNTGVTNYRIYKDGKLIRTVDGSVYSCSVGSLNKRNVYEFRIEAEDATGNRSAQALAFSLPCMHQVTVLFKGTDGKPISGGVVQYYEAEWENSSQISRYYRNWENFGTTDSTGYVKKYLPDGEYCFKIIYEGKLQEKWRRIKGDATVVFHMKDTNHR